MKDNILEKLNNSQKEAVTTTEGPVLIIAGAGSGKTRALTHRVAYLICEKRVRPGNILAVTFTNKAAQEMKERIKSLLESNGGDANFPVMGTFHSICVKILRREIDKIGFKTSFNIFDDQDQLALMKRTMKEMQIDVEQFRPKAILGAISKAKNELIDAEEFKKGIGGYFEEVVSKIYTNYQKKLKEQNALDFDDILMYTAKVFQRFPEVLKKYQNIFRYIMVDEYQDTNHAQYLLIKLLSQKHGNICVVGDDWQGIYSWRGANIQNILDFEKDYPKAKVIKLEQNYRSTQNILDAAYGVISKNVNRKDKKIWTENSGGHLLVSYEADNEKNEAEFIAEEIQKMKKTKHAYGDFVILYRTNAQSRIIEEVMLRNSIPYRIIGGIKFYQRKEVKDVVAYLRLINNFSDEVSLERIINEPKRGIGDITLGKWTQLARKNNKDLIETGLAISNFQLPISKKTPILNDQIKNTKYKIRDAKLDAISKFSEFIVRMAELKKKLLITDFIQKVFVESGYEKYLLDGTEEGEMRQENVRELLTVAKKYEDYEGEEGLNLFLEEVALVSDTDNIDQNIESVHLMTLHSAKGLEFRVVFIAGLEEGILPHSRSMLDHSEMEEERRLMYVGITRAKEKVYLLFTSERNIFGSTQINPPSRFLDDIPSHLVRNYQLPITSLQSNFNDKISNFKKENNFEIQNIKFKDGDRVRHTVFGDGMIVATQGDVITIAFSKVGLKKLSANIAPLKKI
ncbi:MAG TPA: UvrD-helicase domain-containing protein [Candidatus Moranbacteria bacterium]|nr:UvrD-helicase domain-containing protein [Candidatus Moranbacteria bacterium]